MGIPKCFRNIVERYPLINRSASDQPIPHFDCLYLDINGIIHHCTHDSDVATELRSEQEICSLIFAYIENIVDLTQPQKLIYVAVDGVAPRSKINQQRQRRFRAAWVMEQTKENLKEEEKDKIFFDSNSITPGTVFLDRICEAIHYFLKRKASTDDAWKNLQVIFSDYGTPGEGEHKIAEFIRTKRFEDGYNPDTTHCLYGLDADLIMLALATHEPHFYLIREKVTFKSARQLEREKGQKTVNLIANNNEFEFFSVSLLREYIGEDLRTTNQRNLERTIDDFVFLSFLVGNDFIPSLPYVEMGDGGIEALIEIYKKLESKWGVDGFLANAKDGTVDPQRFIDLLKLLAEREETVVAQNMKLIEEQRELLKKLEAEKLANNGEEKLPLKGYDLQDLLPAILRGENEEIEAIIGEEPETIQSVEIEAKTEVKPELVKVEQNVKVTAVWGSSGAGSASSPSSNSDVAKEAASAQLRNLILNRESNSDSSEVDAATMLKKLLSMSSSKAEKEKIVVTEEDKKIFRESYYKKRETLPTSQTIASESLIESLAKNYIEGLRFVFRYYYKGVPSWTWYYEYMFAPFAHDMLKYMEKGGAAGKMEEGKPMRPMEHLLSVLPPSSASLLPPSLGSLISDPSSPLSKYYPSQYDVFPDEKGRNWKDIPLIPFIDQRTLLETTSSLISGLTEEEKRRNEIKTPVVISYSKDGVNLITSPIESLPTIQEANVTETPLVLPELPGGKFNPILLTKNITPSTLPHGYPTLHSRTIETKLSNIGVKTFGWKSKCETLVISVKNTISRQALNQVIDKIIGSVCSIFPHNKICKVEAVLTPSNYYEKAKNNTLKTLPPVNDFNQITEKLQHDWLNFHGIDVAPLHVVCKVQLFEGMALEKDGSLKRVFNPDSVYVPFSLLLPPNTIRKDDRIEEKNPVDKAFQLPVGAEVMIVSQGPLYGRIGTVEENPTGKGTLSVKLIGRDIEPNLTDLLAQHQLNWVPLQVISKTLGLNSLSLLRITGSVPFTHFENTVDLGLQLKSARKGLCCPGYTKLGDDGKFLFSNLTIDLIREYREKFPSLFTYIASDPKRDLFDAKEAFSTENSDDESWKITLKNAIDWLNKSPASTIPFVSTITDQIPAKLYPLIETVIIEAPHSKRKDKNSLVSGSIVEVSIEEVINPAVHPSPQANFLLGDRIAYSRHYGPVDFGSKGTITSISRRSARNSSSPASKMDGYAEIIFDRELLSGTKLGGRIRTHRGAVIQIKHLVNISKGRVAFPSSASKGGRSASKSSANDNVAKPANLFALLQDEE